MLHNELAACRAKLAQVREICERANWLAPDRDWSAWETRRQDASAVLDVLAEMP